MRARLLTLLALATCWPAWVVAGWVAQRISPGGGEWLLQAGLALLSLGLVGRLLDRLDARRTHG